MTLEELDAALAAGPKDGVILLTKADFHELMGDPRALPHRVSHATHPRFIYRGLPVRIVAEGPSRVAEAGEGR